MSKDSILSFRFGRQDLVVPADNFYIPYATYIAGEYDFLDINDDDIVIDAGANIGDFTLKAARDAELVIAIEPNPDTLELLKFNTKNHKNVVIVEKALGSRPGKGIVSGNGV
ncbi:MAG: FkbM family methyltransferase, partial [Nitrososphaerota archaeon]|nr:FkbM family methyltransferase [Nitrososphaerota archaeon]